MRPSTRTVVGRLRTAETAGSDSDDVGVFAGRLSDRGRIPGRVRRACWVLLYGTGRASRGSKASRDVSPTATRPPKQPGLSFRTEVRSGVRYGLATKMSTRISPFTESRDEYGVQCTSGEPGRPQGPRGPFGGRSVNGLEGDAPLAPPRWGLVHAGHSVRKPSSSNETHCVKERDPGGPPARRQ